MATMASIKYSNISVFPGTLILYTGDRCLKEGKYSHTIRSNWMKMA